LFPKGLTLLDLAAIGEDAGLAHVAARGELRELIAGLELPDASAAPKRETEAA
jgi:chromosome partitioning protein